MILRRVIDLIGKGNSPSGTSNWFPASQQGCIIRDGDFKQGKFFGCKESKEMPNGRIEYGRNKLLEKRNEARKTCGVPPRLM